MPDLSSTGTPADAAARVTAAGDKSDPRALPDEGERVRFDTAIGRNMFLGSVAEHSLAPAHGVQVAVILSIVLWILATILLWWLW